MSEELRTAVLEGLRAFAEEEPDFAMSHGMRARAADFILAQPRPAPKADGLVEELRERAAMLLANAIPDTDDDDRDLVEYSRAINAILAALKDRDVVLEEAAKKLDERASYHGDQDQGPRRSAAWREARECAQVVRNLKERV